MFNHNFNGLDLLVMFLILFLVLRKNKKKGGGSRGSIDYYSFRNPYLGKNKNG